MKKHTLIALASLATALLLAGCASGPSVAELNALTDKIVKSSFRDQSHVKLTRLTETDETTSLAARPMWPASRWMTKPPGRLKRSI